MNKLYLILLLAAMTIVAGCSKQIIPVTTTTAEPAVTTTLPATTIPAITGDLMVNKTGEIVSIEGCNPRAVRTNLDTGEKFCDAKLNKVLMENTGIEYE